MQLETDLPRIAQAIQLAVAPVFLVSGVGALLAVLSNRLSRIVDRARLLEERHLSVQEPQLSVVNAELATLFHRARLINRSISLATTCALLICAVITILFLDAFSGLQASIVVGLVFMAAMLGLIGALVCFLREVQIATRSLRIGLPTPTGERGDGGTA